ncbi:hypothetical protein P280DRAFT_404948, partial [Massarina eburnea CBS 473.64]
VEMVAFYLARLLGEYALELLVDEAMLDSCCGDKVAQRKKWDAAIRQMKDDVEFNINIRIIKDLPIQLARQSG